VKFHEGNIVKIVWVQSELGDAVAFITACGIVSFFEEICEGIIGSVLSFSCLVRSAKVS
jgi:hypothetical protein